MRISKRDYIVKVLIGHNKNITAGEVGRALKRVEKVQK